METPRIFMIVIGTTGSAYAFLGVIFPHLKVYYANGKGWPKRPKIPMSQMGRVIAGAYFAAWTLVVAFANTMLWAIPVMAMLIPMVFVYRRDKRDYENSI